MAKGNRRKPSPSLHIGLPHTPTGKNQTKAWLQIRKPDRPSGDLLELTGSRIKCDWGKPQIHIYQSHPSISSVTIRFTSAEQMQAFLKTFTSLLQESVPLIDTGVEDMDFKDVFGM